MNNKSPERQISNSPLFDRTWYLATYQDVELSGIDPVRHYLHYGAKLGRDPGPYFSTTFYLKMNPDVAQAGVNPLLHYERSGRLERRRYHPSQDLEVISDKPLTKKRPEVDVVIPVYNALSDVQSCLASLTCAETRFQLRVQVVNDGSDATTTAWLRRAVNLLAGPHISFELHEHESNCGYTVAVNTGLRASRADYVVTLNSDTIVTSGWLDGLVRCLESAPDIGIVGPLSNAATWQNVPELYDETGRHAINILPKGTTPEQIAQLVRRVSIKCYPRTTFVNGFCFLIARTVLDAVGYMDEEAFPTGYGEENDFCIRAMDAKFELAYADDVYVYHAKSKSFGSERRVALSKAGGEALRRKHGTNKIADLVDRVNQTEKMDAVRDRLRSAMKDTANSVGAIVTPEEMQLLPPAIHAPKGYVVTPSIGGPMLKLPFHNESGRVPELDLGIHLHLHYVDLAEEFTNYLRHVPVPFHLYVSVPLDSDVKEIEELFTKVLPKAKIRIEAFENRGRDIGPFLAGFGSIISKHDYICHIHSKRSPHNFAKNDWRLQLMTNLMGSPSVVGEVLRLFDQNPDLGIVFPEYHWSLANQISWGSNYAICTELAHLLEIEISPVVMAPFPAGSMFWARRAALAPLFDLGLSFEDFPSEGNQVDGTLAHAIERLLGNIVAATGYKLQQLSTAKPYDLQSYYTVAWPYPAKPANELSKVAETYRTERKKVPAKVGLLCANAGGYDATVMHEYLDPAIDYHLVTDFPAPNCGFWIQHDMAKIGNPTGRARAVKTDPLPYIGSYDIGVWIDANVMIRGTLEQYFKIVEANPDVPIFGIPHPQRNCIYDEAQAVIEHKKADSDKVRAQMAVYQADGYPKRHGLIETNLLVYNLKHPRIAEILTAWRAEVNERTHRDQLSLNYVLWKLGLQWMPLMGEGRCLRTNNDFAYIGHGRNAGYSTPILPPHTVKPRNPTKAA
ncbi:glycosyltransferase [Roseovarius sp. A21]|uniref:Glycosyltransferase n=1 Tax=Roseovarius bejariae TaxID=2576383 RepID=A0A844D0Y0_9RHOB|nr:rhamnan synthesis F family protein [Roseovarius bejariae]MRU15523.1 glycosyltransferase [Roseovarius bejariae]